MISPIENRLISVMLLWALTIFFLFKNFVEQFGEDHFQPISIS